MDACGEDLLKYIPHKSREYSYSGDLISISSVSYCAYCVVAEPT